MPRTLSPKNKVKLLLNLLMVATSTFRAAGASASRPPARARRRFPPAHPGQPFAHSRPYRRAAGRRGPRGGALDAHAVQPHYTGLLARATGYSITLALDGDTVVIAAERG